MLKFLPLLSTLIELVGFALVLWAALLVDYRLALALGGVVLVVFGFALDRPVRSVE